MTGVSLGERPRPDDAFASPSCRRCDDSHAKFSPALEGQAGGIFDREARKALEGSQSDPHAPAAAAPARGTQKPWRLASEMPTVQDRFYIMDQWTAKSVILITGEPVVKVSGDFPSPENTGADYERFCQTVDAIADELSRSGKSYSGQLAEERMFSAGAVGRGKPGKWRAYVKQHWTAEWDRIQKSTPSHSN